MDSGAPVQPPVESSTATGGMGKRIKVLVAFSLLAIVLVVLGVWGMFWAQETLRKELGDQNAHARDQLARDRAFEAALAWVIANEDQEDARRVVDELAASLTESRASEGGSSAAERTLREAEAAYVRESLVSARAEREAHRAQVFYDIETSKRSDTEVRALERERFVPSLRAALRNARDAKRTWIRREARARELEFWLDETWSERRNARRSADAAKGRYDVARAELSSLLGNEAPDPPSDRGGVFEPARDLLARALRSAAPAFLLLGLLIPLAALAGLIPWVRDRLRSLWTTLTAERPAEPGESRFGTLARQRPASFGGFVLRAGAAGTVAVVAAGALALSVPGRSIDLDLGEPEVSEVGVRVGEFGVSIPGKSVTLDTSDPTPPESRVTMEPYTIRIPGKTIDIPESSVTVVSGEGRIDRPEITLRPPDVRIVVEEPRSDDLARILGELTTRMGDLDVRVGRMDSKVEQLYGQIDSANRTLTRVESASGRLVIEAQEEINEVNGKTASALFQQTRIRDNCNRFCGLAATFPESALVRCASPGRFEPFLPWKAPGTTGCGPLGDGRGSEDAGLSMER